MKAIRIGTRGSELALKQVSIFTDLLALALPSLTYDVRVIKTEGDTNQNPIPLEAIGKGWFTKEIEEQLLNNTIDCAVHSLKDMTDDMPSDLTIGAYLPREDARDALITKHGESLEELPQGATIGTDSTRRQKQMLELRGDLVMKSIRGNVPTRIDKLTSESYEGIVLAVAGLKRLNRQDEIVRIFSVDEMTPAPGQGTLAIECNANNSALLEMLARIDDADARRASKIERGFSKTVGGGCKSATGAYARLEDKLWTLTGMIDTEEGVLRDTMSVRLEDASSLGTKLAKKMLTTLHHGSI